jgi:ABC-type nitrate/sulfonate/bicarbonate transport system, permease component
MSITEQIPSTTSNSTGSTVAPAQAAPRPKTPRKNRTARTTLFLVLPPLVVAVIAIVLWQSLISVFGVPKYLVPAPADVLAEIGPAIGSLIQPTLVTMGEAYSGFLLAGVVGFTVAFVMARWNVAERGLYPYMVLLQTIPIIAVAPILVVWLGAGAVTNTVIAAMIAVFPVTANTLTGLKSTDRHLVQLFAMAGATKRYEMAVLRIPYALPYVLTGLRIAAGSSVIGAIVGEFVAGIGGGKGGLGYVITSTAQQLLMPRLFLAVIAASCVSLLLFGVVRLVEVLALRRWHESAMATDD